MRSAGSQYGAERAAMPCRALQLVSQTAVQLQLVQKTAVHCSALHPLHHHTITTKNYSIKINSNQFLYCILER